MRMRWAVALLSMLGCARAFDPESVLRPGATVVVRSAHPDAVDEYEFRLVSGGAREMDCVLPDLAQDKFRAVFTEEALAAGDGLLAVTQTNPYGRGDDGAHGGEDGAYGGDGKPRSYTFRATTPPFLLSAKLGALVRERKPVPLRFYDFLDQGAPIELAFASEEQGTLDVDGRQRPVRIVRYRHPDGHTLAVVAGTRFVALVSRDDGAFEMRVVAIRTR